MTTHIPATNSINSITTTTIARLALGLVGLFLTLFFLLHLIEPEFNPAWRFMSEYALGQYGWVMRLGFFALASSCVATVAAIRPQVQGRAGKIGLILLLIVAAALFMGGLFSQDPVTAQPNELTMHGNLHGLAAMIGLPTFPIAALLISSSLIRYQPAWASARGVLLVTANLIWISLVAMIAYLILAVPQAGGFGPSVMVGWFNRIVVLSECAWLIAVGWHALEVNKKK
jgi:Protein of unknown function (DUF998)